MGSFSFTGGKVWAGLKSQKIEGTAQAEGFTMNGAEVGGSLSLDGFGLVANAQSGKAMGVPSDGDSAPRKQTNVLVQGRFQATPKLKLGLNWGERRLHDGVGTDLRSNSNVIAGLYFGLTRSLTLTGELSRTESQYLAGETARLGGVAAGAILFFCARVHARTAPRPACSAVFERRSVVRFAQQACANACANSKDSLQSRHSLFAATFIHRPNPGHPMNHRLSQRQPAASRAVARLRAARLRVALNRPQTHRLPGEGSA